MTLNKLASIIAKHEGKKHEASVGDIREILKIFLDLYHSDDHADEIIDLLNKEEEKRNNRRARKK